MEKIAPAKTRRSDLFHIDPTEITILAENRGRFLPPSDDEIKKLAVSIFTNTQLEPVQCRKIGGALTLNYGFTRYDAVMLIRAGFDYNGKTYHDPNFMLKVLTVNANDEKAFIANILENNDRTATSPVDDAHNMEKLRQNYGKTDAEIAEIYKVTTQHVKNTAKLLGLSNKHQVMVHTGKMPVTAALELVELPEGEREAAVKAATKASGKVAGTSVRKTVRNKGLTNTSGAAKVKPRTVKEVREFFEAESIKDQPSGTAAKLMARFLAGTITDEAFEAEWEGLFTKSGAFASK